MLNGLISKILDDVSPLLHKRKTETESNMEIRFYELTAVKPRNCASH